MICQIDVYVNVNSVQVELYCYKCRRNKLIRGSGRNEMSVKQNFLYFCIMIK